MSGRRPLFCRRGLGSIRKSEMSHKNSEPVFNLCGNPEEIRHKPDLSLKDQEATLLPQVGLT
jgi:hypothetical protein